MGRHVNIPVFIPHLGCPNQCVFCNQRHISGVTRFELSSVEAEISAALKTVEPDADVEIAFFGGSFTGIDRELMISLLEIANKFTTDGMVRSIRCSTRPDYINREILDILSRYGVRVIELGLQSSRNSVLSASKRGHSFSDEEIATRLITEYGFTLVGQMMIGLPGSDLESEIETARFIVSSGAKYARIYPTVVFKDTELYEMCLSGEYIPLSEEEAVNRGAAVFSVLYEAGIGVIRIGLCASESLASDDSYFAGPNHSALGELILSRYYYNKISRLLDKSSNNISPTVLIARGHASRAIGHGRENKIRLTKEFGLSDIKFKEDDSILPYELKLLF